MLWSGKIYGKLKISKHNMPLTIINLNKRRLYLKILTGRQWHTIEREIMKMHLKAYRIIKQRSVPTIKVMHWLNQVNWKRP